MFITLLLTLKYYITVIFSYYVIQKMIFNKYFHIIAVYVNSAFYDLPNWDLVLLSGFDIRDILMQPSSKSLDH